MHTFSMHLLIIISLFTLILFSIFFHCPQNDTHFQWNFFQRCTRPKRIQFPPQKMTNCGHKFWTEVPKCIYSFYNFILQEKTLIRSSRNYRPIVSQSAGFGWWIRKKKCFAKEICRRKTSIANKHFFQINKLYFFQTARLIF